MTTKDHIQKEALTALRNNSAVGVEISMGVGKTRLGLMHLLENYKEGIKVLVVAPKVSIYDSWKKEAEENGWQHLLNHITFSTYRSLHKLSPTFDIIYLDECHSLKYSHSMMLDMSVFHGTKIIGLTGTYPKHKGSEKYDMCNRYCPVAYTYNTDSAVEDSILNDYRIYVHTIQLGETLNVPVKRKNGAVFYTSEQKAYHFWSGKVDDARSPKDQQFARIQRMKAMMSFPSKEAYAKLLVNRRKTKTIVFANTQEQADRLSPNSYHSKNPRSKQNLELFKTNEIDLLTAVEQLSEGVNIPGLKTGIIMHAYANNRRASQKIGRMLRLNPDDVAGVHILCYDKTIDVKWVKEALSNFDQSKIQWLSSLS